jgi:hypothetical protein
VSLLEVGGFGEGLGDGLVGWLIGIDVGMGIIWTQSFGSVGMIHESFFDPLRSHLSKIGV